jgi:hypothetical protein
MKRAHGEEGLLVGAALHPARVAGGGPPGTSVPWPGNSLRRGGATGTRTPGHAAGRGERPGAQERPE